MDKKYISVDIEASGPIPGKYSMLSLGACLVGNTDQQFYRELKPLSDDFVLPAIKVGVRGLRGLDSRDEFNPDNSKFNPYMVLDALYENGEKPDVVMSDFADWIKQVTQGYQPIEVTSPGKFDGMFTAWYFHNFIGENPLGHNGLDINSFYKGVSENLDASIKDLRTEDLKHNALDDAIQQAEEYEQVLKMIVSRSSFRSFYCQMFD